MWFSGCLLAAPTSPSLPQCSLSFPLPSFICILPYSSFFLLLFFWLALMHSEHFLCKNRSLNKVYDNQNIMAVLANECTFWWFSSMTLAKKERKKSWAVSEQEWGEREKGDMDGRRECWRIRKYEKGESPVKNLRGRSVKEGEVEQKMSWREGGLE